MRVRALLLLVFMLPFFGLAACDDDATGPDETPREETPEG